MAKKIPIEQMDAFCDHLFRALDRADLLPTRLGEAAHSFEKYGRTLASLLGRYDKVEAAFDEWKTRTLRQIKNAFRREEIYPYFQKLRDWMTDEKNRSLFEGNGRKDNLNHFKRSLYGRIYTWLYPRRKLAMAYADVYRGDEAQFAAFVLEQQFTITVQDTLQNLPGADEQTIKDAQAYILMKPAYYSRNKDNSSTTKDDLEQLQNEERK